MNKTKTSKKRSHKKKELVSGYWRGAKWVKPYKRTPVTAKRRKLLAAGRRVEKEFKNPPPKAGWKRYTAIEPEERVTYTYKVVILVRADYKYRMFFTTDESTGEVLNAPVPQDVRKGEIVMQYWHSKFEATIKKATVDFLERVPEIRAYGDVQFITIDLYRVSGEGPLTKKNWKLLRSFDEPEDVQ